MKENYENLLKRAGHAALAAHARYSKFRVGAAVETDIGIFTGFNIEISSSPLGICAERAAITNALVNGAKQITAIAVNCIDADPESDAFACMTMPCGACRQWIAELAGGAVLVTNGSDKVYRIDDLLPNPFFIEST